MKNGEHRTQNTEQIKDIPLISIIVPIYNVEKYLGKCIDSLLNQTYRDFELILVNDGSPDRCGQICDEYAQRDNRIVVIHKENGGVSTARNVGIDIAKGDYIAFIDPDDWVENDFLETYVKNIDGDTLIVQNYNRVYSNGEILYNVWGIKNVKYDFAKDLDVMIRESQNYISLSFPVNKLYSAKIIKENKIRFLEGLRFAEDDRFNSIYFGYVRYVKYIEKGRYYYVYRDDSAVRQSLIGAERYLVDRIERYKTYASFYTMLKNRCECSDFVNDFFQNELESYIRLAIIDYIYKEREYKYIRRIAEMLKECLSFLQSDLIFRKIDYWLLRNRMPLLFHLFRLLRIKINK